MVYRDDILNEYFEWMYNLVCGHRYSEPYSYRKLLMHLHNTEFTFSISKDENRAEDGLRLRYRFGLRNGYENLTDIFEDSPCSVLEMMIALSLRCEEDTMDNPDFGDRTGQWFWSMIINLGLGSMNDKSYDKRLVSESIDRLLNREYEPDGKGGLFRIRNCNRDLRTVEIWYQLNWYLDSIV